MLDDLWGYEMLKFKEPVDNFTFSIPIEFILNDENLISKEELEGGIKFYD